MGDWKGSRGWEEQWRVGGTLGDGRGSGGWVGR